MFDDLKKDQAQMSAGNTNQSPKKIDDMFADVDPAPQIKPLPTPAPLPVMERPSAVQSGKMKPISLNQNFPLPTTSTTQPANFTEPISQDLPASDHMSASRRMIIIFAVFILLLVAVGGVYYFFFKDKAPALLNENENFNVNTNVNENSNFNNNQNTNTNQNVNNVIVDDTLLDDDFDGLSNAEEKVLDTNPYESDTDNDGVFDQDEVEAYHTDPLLDDSDSDNLGDFEEVITYGTDPNDPDSDDDGYLDGTEIINGYNPLGSGLLEDMIPPPPPNNTNLNTSTNENNQ